MQDDDKGDSILKNEIRNKFKDLKSNIDPGIGLIAVETFQNQESRGTKMQESRTINLTTYSSQI